ncbi:Biotin--acetyl-CoA-carboxylase ligase [Trinorchestia longiramus]|nr:Biotin--acetyl-CoA-carboxylase ligase [Trinorchestia longiramus]
MLSMCSLVCRLVRGWKQSEATAIISQSATTPGSSLLLHDLGEPELNVDVGAYIASPYPHFDSPHKFSRKGSCSDCSSQGNIHPAFCQAFAWPERNFNEGREGEGSTSYSRPSLFCQQNCGGQEGGEGACGLLHPPPRVQVIWSDNNRQASLVTPRQSVDLSRWTLFFASEDDLLEHTIRVPDLPAAAPSTSWGVLHESADENVRESSLPSSTSDPNLEVPISAPPQNTKPELSLPTTAPEPSSRVCTGDDLADSFPSTSTSATGSLAKQDDSSNQLKTVNVSHGFGLRGRGKAIGDHNGEGSNGVATASGKNGTNGTSASLGRGCSEGGLSGNKSGARPVVMEHISPSASGAAYDGVKDTSELITILLEARCISNFKKSRDEGCKSPVMADQVCKAYAWKCRGVFGVIAHTTPQRLMLMVDAFFANNLLLDSDLHVTKIVTVDCVGVPGRMTEPTTIAECATPGGYYHTAKQHQHTSLLDAARCLSAADVSRAPSPEQPIVFQPFCRPGKIPHLRSRLQKPHPRLKQNSSSSSLSIENSCAGKTDQFLRFSSSSSSSSDSKSISTDSDDLPIPPVDLQMFCPRGWAISGQRIVIGQPLIADQSARNDSKVSQNRSGPVHASGTIRTNPLGDLWMDMETRRKMASDNRITEESSVESSVEQASSHEMLTSADLGTSLESEEASFEGSESYAESVGFAASSKVSPMETPKDISEEQHRNLQFFENQAKMSADLPGTSTPRHSAFNQELPPVTVHSSKTGPPTLVRPKKNVKKKKKLLPQQEFDLDADSEMKKDYTASASLLRETFGQPRSEVKRQRISQYSKTGGEAKSLPRSPFRTASEQDLLRATAIIRENLTNIVENYLVRIKPDQERISPSKAALDNMTNEKADIDSSIETQQISDIETNALPAADVRHDTNDVLCAETIETRNESSIGDVCDREIQSATDDLNKSMNEDTSISITTVKPQIIEHESCETVSSFDLEQVKHPESEISPIEAVPPLEVQDRLSVTTTDIDLTIIPPIAAPQSARVNYGKLIKVDSMEESFEQIDPEAKTDIWHANDAEKQQLVKSDPFGVPPNVAITPTGFDSDFSSLIEAHISSNPEVPVSVLNDIDAGVIAAVQAVADNVTSLDGSSNDKEVHEHPSIDIIDETGLSCRYDETKEPISVTFEDVVSKLDKKSLAHKFGTQLSDLASEGSFESLPYNALMSQSGSFTDDTDPPVSITFHSYQHFESVKKLVRQKSSGSEDILDSEENKLPKSGAVSDSEAYVKTFSDEPTLSNVSAVEGSNGKSMTSSTDDTSEQIVTSADWFPVSTDRIKSETKDVASSAAVSPDQFANDRDSFGMVDINIIVAEESSKKVGCSDASYDLEEGDENEAPIQKVLKFQESEETLSGGLTTSGVGKNGQDSEVSRTAVSDREDDRFAREISIDSSLLQDSGLDTSLETSGIHQDSSFNKGTSSPVESVPESGFSSLKENFAHDQNFSEDSPEMTLSKSKDSLDLTDNERFPGTDTLSDEIETMSAFASRTESVEGSFRGSASDIASLESGSNGLSQLQSCGTSRDLPDIDLDSLVIPNSHVEKGLCRQLALQSTLTMQESRETIPYQEALHKETPSEKDDTITEKTSLKSEKNASTSEDVSSTGIKTSDSLSSEDTILSKISIDDHNKLSTDEQASSRLSSDDHSKVSLEEASKVSSTDQSKMSMDDLSKYSSTDVSKFSTDDDLKCSIDSQFLSLDDPSLTCSLPCQSSVTKVDAQESILEEDENSKHEISQQHETNFEQNVSNESSLACNDQPFIKDESADEVDNKSLFSDSENKGLNYDIPLFTMESSSVPELGDRSMDSDALENLTAIVERTLPHLSTGPPQKLGAITPAPSLDFSIDPASKFPSSKVSGSDKFQTNDGHQIPESEKFEKTEVATIVEEGESEKSLVEDTVENYLIETPSVVTKSVRPKSHEVHKRRKKRSVRDALNEASTQGADSPRLHSSRAHRSHRSSKGSIKSDASGSRGSLANVSETSPFVSPRPSLANLTSSSGSTQDEDVIWTKSLPHRIVPPSIKSSGLSNFGSASSSFHSDESGVPFESVSLRSEGSFDKFPHFDAVRAQVKPRTPKKKHQSVHVEENKEKKFDVMQRSVTLPVGSLLYKAEHRKNDSGKSNENERIKDELHYKKKKKDKDSSKSEKKSAISSIKGLLKRNKTKAKNKEENDEKEKTSPSLFRRFERKSKSQSPPQMGEKFTSNPPKFSSKPPIAIIHESLTHGITFQSPNPDIQSAQNPGNVLATKSKAGSHVDLGVAATVLRTSSSNSNRSSSMVSSSPLYQPMSEESQSNSSHSSPISVRHSAPTSPRKSSALSPQLYRRVLTRNISSSQESLESTRIGVSPSASPQKKRERTSHGASSPGLEKVLTPHVGTRAPSPNIVSVTIGFKPKIEKRDGRTRSEGTHLDEIPIGLGLDDPIENRETTSRNISSPSKLNKRSSSMEILVCGKIREHCRDRTSPGGSFSREGSFRLHREISVETLVERPESSTKNKVENYQDYLSRVQASRDSQHNSSWSLCEIDETSPVKSFVPAMDTDITYRSLPRSGRSAHRSSGRHGLGGVSPQPSHRAKFGKKTSLPHNFYLSERSGVPENRGSDLSLQDTASPLKSGMIHSASFTASPFKRPRSATLGNLGLGNFTAVSSPLKKSYFVSTTASGGRSPIGGEPSSPVPCLEEVLEERDSTHSSVSPEPSSLPSDVADYFTDKPQTATEALFFSNNNNSSNNHASSATNGSQASSSTNNNQPPSHGSTKDVSTNSDDGSDFSLQPPNILVYANNNETYFESIKDTLLSCLKKDRYAVYHLTGETAFRSPWTSSTTLLVICGDVQAHVSTVFIRYLLRGGRVLSICSDFLNVAVPLFGTVEVAESPVVGVRYGRWGSVQFLHHQHCSHHSPQSNRFSTHLDVDDKPGTTPITTPRGGTVSVEPTHVEIKDTDGKSHCLQLRVLATDDTWGAPSLIGARVRGGQGRGVFSQVHLERGPTTSTDTTKLNGSNSWEHRSARARKEILKDLLASELCMDTEKDDQDEWGDQAEESQASIAPVFTPAVLYGTEKRKQNLLTKLRPKLLGGRELHRPRLRLVFHSSAAEAQEASVDVLPVLYGEGATADGFDWRAYNEKLETNEIGRLLLYSELMASSMLVVEGATLLSHGIAVVPRRQSKGTGRSGNAWLSPEGCMMYTLQLHLPMTSFLGSHLPLIQHIVSLAVVVSLTRDHPLLQLSLKWPNDIYAGQSKLGGVLVQSTLTGSTACVNIGVGVNLTNSAPSISVQQLLKKMQEANAAEVKLETTLAGVFNATEQLINLVERQGPEPVIQMYYSFWKHSGAKVTVLQAEDHTSHSTGRSCRTVTITGVGVNLTNSAPSISVQQLLKKMQEANPTEVKLETTLAGVFNATEQLINLVERQGPEPVIQMYYSFWKHSGAKVTVLQAEDHTSHSTGRSCRTVTITGIDYYGFLKGVDCETGEAVPIQPDGNSFDMMEGLVYTKIRISTNLDNSK